MAPCLAYPWDLEVEPRALLTDVAKKTLTTILCTRKFSVLVVVYNLCINFHLTFYISSNSRFNILVINMLKNSLKDKTKLKVFYP